MKLADHQIQLVDVLVHMPFFVIVLGEDRRVRWTSQAILQLAGKTEEEIIGLRGGEALRCAHHLDDPEGCGFGEACRSCAVRRIITDTIDTGRSHEKSPAKLAIIGDSVAERSLLVSTTRLESVEESKVVIYIEDVTERAETEAELKESEERYRALVENTQFGLFLADDPRGPFSFVNESFCELFRCSPEEAKERSLADIIHPEEHAWVLSRVDECQAISLPKKGIVRCRGVRQDGTELRFELAVTPVELGSGKAFQGLIRDVTMEEYFENQLRHTQKMDELGMLAGGIAHDFNNILMIILGNAELIAANDELDLETARGIEEILQGSRQAAALLKKMMRLSRVHTGEQSLVHINHLVDSIHEILQTTSHSGIEIVVDLDEDVSSVRGDPGQLEQVIIALANNALDAMPDGGRLTLRTRLVHMDEASCEARIWAQPGDYVAVSVADTGRGMAREIMERAFNPFFTTKGPSAGNGLGLSVAYSIVQSHGGGIEVESSSGKGSTFRVFVPTVEVKVAELFSSVKQSQWPTNKGESILVVDDSPRLRELLRQALETVGFRVEVAPSGSEAVHRYESSHRQGRQFDLVLLDLEMPGMNGWECREALLDLDPEARTLMMTGVPKKHRMEVYGPDKERTILEKPIELPKLFREVQRELSVRRDRAHDGSHLSRST